MGVVDGIAHGRRALGLNAVHLDIGVQTLDGKGHAGDQAAAADGDNDGVHVLDLLGQLQSNGALPGNHVGVVKGVDEGIALLVPQFQRPAVGVVVDALHQTDFRAVAAGGLHLGDGGPVGQADDGLDAVALGGQCHTLGVVSGGTGDDAPRLLLLRQLGHFIVGSADFKGAGDLQIFGFQIQLPAGAQLGGVEDIRLTDDAAQCVIGLVDRVQGQLFGGIFHR